MRPTPMRYLGMLRGRGTLSCDGESLGDVEFEIEGFRTRPGDVVGSGEIRMAPAELGRSYGRKNLMLTTDDGRVMAVRFSGSRRDASTGAAHADFTGGGLPAADQWTR
jgi:hypothetical protein